MDSYIVLFYLTFIIALQSTVGVGVLVLGTPFLLILNYDMLQIFLILLPISILTSFINLIFMKFKNKKKQYIKKKQIIKFFSICIPSILIGMIILKYLQTVLNFKFLVSVVIIFSTILVSIKKKIKFKINFFRTSILSTIGIVHGLTNSGGTLMSLALTSNSEKDFARYSITYFYLILAFFQYLITIIIFHNYYFFFIDLKILFLVIVGVCFGNLFNLFLNDNIYKLIVSLLALVSAIVLLLNN
tara:strand:+ start:18 stop:749 length:732 start_codon:yes stop_codon:yes gene_type:complete